MAGDGMAGAVAGGMVGGVVGGMVSTAVPTTVAMNKIHYTGSESCTKWLLSYIRRGGT